MVQYRRNYLTRTYICMDGIDDGDDGPCTIPISHRWISVLTHRA